MTSPARSRPSRENPPLKLGQMDKLRSWHHERLAVVYVRQSTAQQVLVHGESTRLQYGLVTRAEAYGWTSERILVIDDGLGQSSTTAVGRNRFQPPVIQVRPGPI